MVFEVGKYYKHNGGFLHTLCEVETQMFGKGIMAETNDPFRPFIPVILGDIPASGWEETTKEEWLANFEEEEKSEGKGDSHE